MHIRIEFSASLSFDRCETRDERKDTFLGTLDNPFVYLACDGIDLSEKDFDTSLFNSIKARNSYGYNEQGSPGLLDFAWSDTLQGEFAALEGKIVSGLGCSGREELNTHFAHLQDDVLYRCLIDVENADVKRWSATAMYEIFRSRLFFNDVKSRLTARRLFIDIPAEQAAARGIIPGLRVMVDGIKATIVERVSKKSSEDNAVSKILGGGN